MISIVLLALGLAAQTSAECTRAALEAASAAYIKAQTAGQPSLLTLSANITYIENDKSVPLAQGVLSKALAATFSRSIHDTVQCATFTEFASAASSNPYVIHTHMLLSGPDANLTVTTIDSVVTTTGDWAFDAAAFAKYAAAETGWGPIPADSPLRTSRDNIKAAADAYLDRTSHFPS